MTPTSIRLYINKSVIRTHNVWKKTLRLIFSFVSPTTEAQIRKNKSLKNTGNPRGFLLWSLQCFFDLETL